MAEDFNQRAPHAEEDDISAQVAEFPSEPFPCPACGQLLAPSCRVCVACKHAIDPAELVQEVAPPAVYAPSIQARQETVPYPWRIFFAVLGFTFALGLLFAATIASGLVKEEQVRSAMQGAPVLVGLWVFFDALRRRVPRPLRWAVGTMLLLAVILPWYLARRSKPRASVPFVEAEVGPVTRLLLFAVLFTLLAYLLYVRVKGSPPGATPTPPHQEHNTGDGSQPRIARHQPVTLRFWRGSEWPRPLPTGSAAQAEMSAPSDAWHT
jgi:hypothetical protein